MMIALIKRLLAPPVFDEDEEKTRKAALLNILLVASFGLITIYLITIPLLLYKDSPLWYLEPLPTGRNELGADAQRLCALCLGSGRSA
jgi:hypothetical protein